MFLIKKLISAWVLSPAGLGLFALFGLALYVWRGRRIGIWISATCTAMLIVLSLPIASSRLMRTVEIATAAPEELDHVQAIVVLGGGIHRGAPEFGQAATVSMATLVRVRYGAWLARRNHLPILVSGGSVFGGQAEAVLMADVLREEFGVPARWIEVQSRDTAENAALSGRILKREGVRRIALVSQAFHLRRAIPLFEREGLIVVAAPTLITEADDGLEAWLPSAASLQASFVAIHEICGALLS